MNRLLSLYQLAQDDGIEVDSFVMTAAESFSLLEDGVPSIVIDPSKVESETDELLKLAHEMGHCETGAFYNRYIPFDLRRKHERRATNWAITYLVPFCSLVDAYLGGCRELWEYAEWLDLPPPFVQEAVEYYKSANSFQKIRKTALCGNRERP